MKVGVLALQGAFARHARAVERLGAASLEVRVPEQLDDIDALILPGGESTTMSKLLESQQLAGPLAERLAGGLPVFGTCAGMILLATSIVDGRSDQRCFGAIDLVARRNAYGRQVDSFETDLDVAGLDEPFHAVFIRAPGVDRLGPGVKVLAEVDGAPVLCASGPVMVASFHPELTDDLRLHELFLKSLGEKK